MKGQDYSYIRQYYGVPAARGVRVCCNGDHGTITSSAGAHLRVRMDHASRPTIRELCHPTWEMTYYGPGGTVIWPKPEEAQ